MWPTPPRSGGEDSPANVDLRIAQMSAETHGTYGRKLTPAQVRRIVSRVLDNGERVADVAKAFGVTAGTVRHHVRKHS